MSFNGSGLKFDGVSFQQSTIPDFEDTLGIHIPNNVYDYDQTESEKPDKNALDGFCGDWKIVEFDMWYPKVVYPASGNWLSLTGLNTNHLMAMGRRPQRAADGLANNRTRRIFALDSAINSDMSRTQNTVSAWKQEPYHVGTDIYQLTGIGSLMFRICKDQDSISFADGTTQGYVAYEVDWLNVSSSEWENSWTNSTLNEQSITPDAGGTDGFVAPYVLYTANTMAGSPGVNGNGIIYTITSNTTGADPQHTTHIAEFANSQFIYATDPPNTLNGPIDIETSPDGTVFVMYAGGFGDSSSSVYVYAFPASNTAAPYLVLKADQTTTPDVSPFAGDARNGLVAYQGVKDFLKIGGSDNSLYINGGNLIRIRPSSTGSYQAADTAKTRVLGDSVIAGGAAFGRITNDEEVQNFYVDDEDRVFYVMRNNPNTVQMVTQTRAPGSSTWEVSSNAAVLLEVGDSGYHKFTPGANLVFCDMAMDDDKNLYVASASQWENSYTSNGHVFKITPNKSGDYAVGCGTITVIANNIPSPISIDVNSRQQVFVSSHAAYDGFASSVGGVFIIDNGNLQLIANGTYYIATSSATRPTANIYGGRILVGSRYVGNSVSTDYIYDGSVYWSSMRRWDLAATNHAANTILRITSNTTGGYALTNPSSGANVHLIMSAQLRNGSNDLNPDNGFRPMGNPIALKKQWI